MYRLILLIACTLSVGCLPPAQPQTPAPQPDPFATPAQPHYPHPSQPYCPDGLCPLPNGDIGSTETLTSSAAILSGCVDCPQQAAAARATNPQLREKKTGSYRCHSCRTPMVGDQFADMWSADGTSLHCLCRDCYDRMSPTQREDAINSWLRGADPGLRARPGIRQAIADVSAR